MISKRFCISDKFFHIVIVYNDKIILTIQRTGENTFYAYHYSVGLLKEKEESILEDSIEYLEKSISARISDINEDYSVLIFFLKKKYLRSMIREEAQKRQTTILILDQDGNTVVREGDPDRLTNEEYGTLAKEMKENTGESPKKDWMGIHIRPIELMDWDIVYIYDVNILYRQAGQIRNAALVIFAFAVLAVVLTASVISRTVAEPIQALAKSMDEAVENHMEVTFQPKYNDEIAHLTRRFRALMQRVAALMTEVKQAEEQKRIENAQAVNLLRKSRNGSRT